MSEGDKEEEEARFNEDVKRVFNAFDKDGSGDIDVQELKQALPQLGVNWRVEAEQQVTEKASRHPAIDPATLFCGPWLL